MAQRRPRFHIEMIEQEIALEQLRGYQSGRGRMYGGASPRLTGGDVDAQWQMAELVGDEAACGSTMTPDQNVVDEFASAVGIHYEPTEELWLGDKEQDRDRHRWELDPASSDDYFERTHAPSTSMRWRHFKH